MATNQYGVVQKRWLTAFILSLFLGILGADRFYLGKAGTGVLKLITFGGFGLWALIDFILIATKSMPGIEWVQDGENDKKVAWIIFSVAMLLGLIIVISSSSSDGSAANTNSDQQATGSEELQEVDNERGVNIDSVGSAEVEPEPEEEPETAERVAQGEKNTLGAGTFTGGQDLAVGLYDVTPGRGESGNFIVNGGSSYNEVLGSDFGVNKIRAEISDGDEIKISGLSSVKFTPVTTEFITEHKKVSLYAGTFVVGEDVGAGRYKVRPGSGESGNFIVNSGASYNEILGSDFGVPEVTATLDEGDVIKLSGLSEVTFTPSN